jgi:hypothetical protein
MLLGSDWNFGNNNRSLRCRLNLGLASEREFGGAWKSGVRPVPHHIRPRSFNSLFQ